MGRLASVTGPALQEAGAVPLLPSQPGGKQLLQAAVSFSRDLPDPGIEPVSPASAALAGGFLYHWPTWGALFVCLFGASGLVAACRVLTAALGLSL